MNIVKWNYVYFLTCGAKYQVRNGHEIWRINPESNDWYIIKQQEWIAIMLPFIVERV